MYIRLGQTKLNKISTPFIEEEVVFASVIDSGMSFEKPTTVRTIEELDVWFGKDYPEYDYFVSLLERGTSLVLSKPLLPGINEDYIDYKKVGRINLHKDDPTFPNFSDLIFTLDSGNYKFKGNTWIEVETLGESDYVVFNCNKKAIDITKPGTSQNFIFESIGRDGDLEEIEWDNEVGGFRYFQDLNDYSKDVSNSVSLYNRDTLCLCDMSNPNLSIDHYHPLAKPIPEFSKFLPSKLSEVTIDKPGIDVDRISDGKDLLVYSINTNYISWSSLVNNTSDTTPYIVFQIPKDGKAITLIAYIVSLGGIDKGEEIKTKLGLSESKLIKIEIDPSQSEKEGRKSIKNKLLEGISNQSGDINLVDDSGVLYIIPTKKLIKLNSLEFSEIPGLHIVPEVWISSYYLEKLLSNQDRALFVSKTIGSCRKFKDPITIEIENITDYEFSVDNLYYRITIRRGLYEELFEGPLFGKDRLDVAISNNSRLVRASFNDWFLTKSGDKILYSKVNSTGNYPSVIPNLPEGKWELKGAYYEGNLDTESYKRPIQKLVDDGFEQWPIDFILIPKVDKFCKKPEDYGFLISASESLNCQVLIQNSKVDVEIVDIDVESLENRTAQIIRDPKKVYRISDRIEGGKDEYTIITRYISGSDLTFLDGFEIRRLLAGSDFVDNVIDDDNRLVYFYGDMIVDGKIRPGYFVFLEDLFKNDIYLGSEEDIIYESPIDPLNSDPYVSNELSEYLKEKKCNYLVDNNHYYYYSELFSGIKPKTSIWMRFIADRIKRDLEKNKWSIISKSTKSNIQSTILDVLGNIKSKFSIVRSINIGKFELMEEKQSLYLEIDTKISDVISTDITLDIILNYSN